MTTNQHEVRLAIYDLSHGLARQLSAQFLGPNHAIDIIPHTSLLVYGREYYFGGGIQCSSPGEFRSYSQLAPIEVQSLGHTTLTQSEFESWCVSVASSGEFAPESYDLLRKNCNNFSHDAATRGLNLSRGVPQWILDVPSRFLSSPMGQMIRPVLENMQLSGPGAVGGGSGAPFGGAATTGGPAPMPAAAPAHAPVENPWADIPAASITGAADTIDTPIIDSHNKPLLSSDTNTIKICIAKLVSAEENSANIQKSLAELAAVLHEPKSSLAHELLEHTVPFLLGHLEQKETTLNLQAVYSLMLLRLVVLHSPADDGARIVLSEIISIIGGRLIAGTSEDGKDDDSMFASHAVRSMAWCSMSNAAGTTEGSRFLRSDAALLSGLLDAALMDTSPAHRPRAEVRQSALALLYNVTHVMTASSKPSGEDELSDTHVTLLCGMLEGLDEETNSTARLRRLLIVGKILKPNHEGRGKGEVNIAAKGLVMDLGFIDMIASLRDSAIGEEGDAKQAQDLAAEICSILS